MTRSPTEDVAVTAAKARIRDGVRRRRADRPVTSRRADDELRTGRLVDELFAATGVTTDPTRVAAYLSSGTEPDTFAIVDRLAARGVEVLLPASVEGAWSEPAWAVYAGANRLRTGPREIPEPSSPRLPAGAVGNAEVVLCPGLAGTRSGDRLGRGGGWYDRVLPLTGSGATVILLLNDDEILDHLPTGPFDRRVDAIVTPGRWLVCHIAD